jgi:hypothetical protein
VPCSQRALAKVSNVRPELWPNARDSLTLTGKSVLDSFALFFWIGKEGNPVYGLALVYQYRIFCILSQIDAVLSTLFRTHRHIVYWRLV